MAHFEVKNLSFSYSTGGGRKALNNINLSIEQGQYITICGKSGSGKTTLLRHLKTVLAPHGRLEGEILFEGKALGDVDLRNQSERIGYVMQNPDNQIVTDKVWHELAFGLESLGVEQKTIRLRVAEMASYFGIQGWFHKDVAELSGGQKQLLNLASIMAMQPSVLILDEPTSQLDPIAATDFLNTVRKINLELGTTVIITEHRLEDILHASDRVIVMNQGRIIADDEPKRVGEYLRGANNEMFAAMPSPVQIYYGVDHKKGERDFAQSCPLTVREGRNWLSEIFDTDGNGVLPEYVSVPEEKTEHEDSEGSFAVTVREVWFRYEKELPDILKGVSFHVREGSIFAIVGGNGTGKSTMLKAICNICRPYRGKIIIKGKRVDKYSAGELFKNNLAMLPQDPQSLFVKKTIREDLAEMCEEKAEGKIAEVAELCGITELLESH
ncbi:MAG: ATP-binding cassette domain-containing protein, partial [Bacillota bacterium]|nr:ATP-binding cassette domain-containing protein [Bacillota bacterium]